MPLPFLVPLAATAAGTGLSALGSLLNRPRRPRFPLEALMRMSREGAFSDVNQATANAGAQLGSRFAAQGFGNSGIGTGVLSRLQQGLTSNALSDLARTRAALTQQKAAMDEDYNQRRAAFPSQVLGEIGQGLGGIGGLLEGSRQNELYKKLLMQLYGEDWPTDWSAGGGYNAPYATDYSGYLG